MAIAANSRADDPIEIESGAAPEYFPAPTAVEQRFEQALKRPITGTFDETPIFEALKLLSEQADAPIRFASFLESELSDTLEATTLSGDFRDTPLRAILQRIGFNSDDLDMPVTPIWYVADDGITLTIRQIAFYGGRNNVRRIYPIGDLCKDDDAGQIVELLKSSVGMYWKTTTADGATAIIAGGMTYTVEDDDDIIAMMAYAGSITYLKSIQALVVQTDLATHSELLEMLRMLRQAKQAFEAGSAAQSTAAGARYDSADTDFTLADPFAQ